MQPVFEAIVQSAARLCAGAMRQRLALDDGDAASLRRCARRATARCWKSRQSASVRLVRDRAAIGPRDPERGSRPRIADVDAAIPDSPDRHARRIGRLSRACCGVPLMRDGRAHRRDHAARDRSVGPFTREADRAARDLRRPGGDRDRERAAVQRDARRRWSSRPRRPRSCASSAARRPTRSRCSTRSSRARHGSVERDRRPDLLVDGETRAPRRERTRAGADADARQDAVPDRTVTRTARVARRATRRRARREIDDL